MADLDDVRRIVESLPETTFARDDHDAVGASVAGKGFAWTWNQRVEPKQPRVPRPEVLAVRVAGDGAKQELLAADGEKFFTEHTDELRELLTDAWRAKAPRALVKASGL